MVNAKVLGFGLERRQNLCEVDEVMPSCHWRCFPWFVVLGLQKSWFWGLDIELGFHKTKTKRESERNLIKLWKLAHKNVIHTKSQDKPIPPFLQLHTWVYWFSLANILSIANSPRHSTSVVESCKLTRLLTREILQQVRSNCIFLKNT